LVQTLHNVIVNNTKHFLDGKATWEIFTSCFKVLIDKGRNFTNSIQLDSINTENFMFYIGAQKNTVLYQEAERTVCDSMTFLLNSCSSMYLKPTTIYPNNFGYSTSSIELRDKLLFCLCKVLNYFIDILEQHSSDSLKQQSISMKQQTFSNNNFLGDAVLDFETMNLTFALKSIHKMFLADGNANTLRSLMIK
jgi:hypothetical protein